MVHWRVLCNFPILVGQKKLPEVRIAYPINVVASTQFKRAVALNLLFQCRLEQFLRIFHSSVVTVHGFDHLERINTMNEIKILVSVNMNTLINNKSV